MPRVPGFRRSFLHRRQALHLKYLFKLCLTKPHARVLSARVVLPRV